MNVLGMIRSHCYANHEVRFDCLLVLNQEVLNDIMIAEENNFVPRKLGWRFSHFFILDSLT